MLRNLFLLTCLLTALLLTSCGGENSERIADDLSPTAAPDESVFMLSAEEAVAIAAGEDPVPTFSFGDADLGPIGISSPPEQSQGAVVLGDLRSDFGTRLLEGEPLHGEGKSASSKRYKCKQCKRWWCKKVDRCKDVEPDYCDCDIVGICNFTGRFWNACDCCDPKADITYSAKVIFSNDNCDKDGVEVIFKRDGQEVGRSTTNEHGWAYFTETGVPRGKQKTTVCVSSNTDVQDGNNWKCGRCGDHKSGNNGGNPVEFCADLPVSVYMTCFKGIIWGKGEIPGCDAANTTGKAKFMFRNTFEDGNFQGKLTYMDGNVNIVDEPITWMAYDGLQAWFGNGKWMVHAVDGGKSFKDDWFEIWIWDTGYHNGQNLLNCFVSSSFRHTFKCDPPAPAPQP